METNNSYSPEPNTFPRHKSKTTVKYMEIKLLKNDGLLVSVYWETEQKHLNLNVFTVLFHRLLNCYKFFFLVKSTGKVTKSKNI